MLDKSIPYYPLMMYKTDTDSYPHYDLPDGYEFVLYQKGDERHWVEIEMSVGQFATEEEGHSCFRREFLQENAPSLEERMLFVKAKSGEFVATATLWNGDYLGEEKQRLHWLAVKDSHGGKGIAKALLSRLLSRYGELGYKGFLFLRTGTWNYTAISIYRKFGFTEYRGERSPFPKTDDVAFREQNEKALTIVNERISAFRK